MDNSLKLGANSKTQAQVQKFGRFLSGMVLPNIGAFIAWGFITALFIPTGWLPNEKMATLVGPMITYLLPLLIGFTGGRMVADVRGGVVGAVATMGVVVGADIPMFLGAMLMGPLGGWVIKKFDKAIDGKIPSGFEMLVNNFSAGILGMILALLALVAIGPTVLSLNTFLGNGVKAIVDANMLPFASIFVEPAKVLFLNNAINHGVLSPLGVQDVASAGKSIFFMVEANPGPGLGILLAYWLFAKGAVKESAPSAIIIHFLGGIHEIYFPYILMKPILILAAIAGGMSGLFTFHLLGAGLVASPSPGSIIAFMAMAPKGGLLPVLAGVAVATAVSFVVAAFLFKVGKKESDVDLEAAKAAVKDIKGTAPKADVLKAVNVKKIIVACDAGMGSSAMGASSLKKKVQAAGLAIDVANAAVDNIPKDADIVITHESLAERVKQKGLNAEVITITNFVGTPVYDELIAKLKA